MSMPDITEADIGKFLSEYNKSVGPASDPLEFDAARRAIIRTWEDVQACPGSGKTTLVAAKLLLLGKKWTSPHRGICVLTHTNVARDEIVGKLQKHPTGFQVIRYPHFVGTIQEFVNRFLALPYVRSKYDFKRLVEEEDLAFEVRRTRLPNTSVNEICRNLWASCARVDYDTIKRYLGSLHYVNENGDLRLAAQYGAPINSPATSTASRRLLLVELKENLCNAGLFLYRDMYAFAEILLSESPGVIRSMQERFPAVIVDEMQDTQDFQDSVLNRIFGEDTVCLQRLGDPDQGIFDGMGGEQPNRSFNAKGDLQQLGSSHRFGLDIAEKIVGLRHSGVRVLDSCRDPARGSCPHTLFLYDDETRGQVLEAFGTHVDQADPERVWRNVKAVGGVDGANGEIRRYWSAFDKSRAPSAPRPDRLVQVAHLAANVREGHGARIYERILQAVADLLRKADVKTTNARGQQVYFAPQSLTRWLKDEGRYERFRRLIARWFMTPVSSAENWEREINELRDILDVGELHGEAAAFTNFDSSAAPEDDSQDGNPNCYICGNGREIEVGTIHSIKGETHDATLLLETKFFQWFDCKQMLPFMIDGGLKRPDYDPSAPRKKNSVFSQFMRKTYVAGSRPRHLLCIAMDRRNITDDAIQALQDNNWHVEYLNSQDVTLNA